MTGPPPHDEAAADGGPPETPPATAPHANPPRRKERGLRRNGNGFERETRCVAAELLESPSHRRTFGSASCAGARLRIVKASRRTQHHAPMAAYHPT